jgi:hypothetical protein
MRVRYAEAGDAAACAAILAEAAAHMQLVGARAWDAADIAADTIQAHIAAGELIVAESSGVIVASQLLQWRDTLFWPDRDDDAAGYLHKVAVRRSHSGGVATVPLVAFASEEAARRGKRFVRLDCAPLPKLMAVYERLGFTQIDFLKLPELGADFRVARFEKSVP